MKKENVYMAEEPKIHTRVRGWGNLMFQFEGEQYLGQSITDTKVTVNGIELCWITWDSIDEFMSDLQEIIGKHAI